MGPFFLDGHFFVFCSRNIEHAHSSVKASPNAAAAARYNSQLELARLPSPMDDRRPSGAVSR